jgi:hypothetical protein
MEEFMHLLLHIFSIKQRFWRPATEESPIHEVEEKKKRKENILT